MNSHCWYKPHLRRESGVWVARMIQIKSDKFSSYRFLWVGCGVTPREAIRELRYRYDNRAQN